jgi:hypothetical protein
LVATHVADEVDEEAPLSEPPPTVDALEAVVVATAHDRLEWEVVELLLHEEARTARRATVVVELDDRVGADVLRAGDAVVDDGAVAVESVDRVDA